MSNQQAVVALGTLSVVNFLENYMRSLLSVSIVPFLDYDSYNYSLLSGTFFAIMYTCGGLFFALSHSLQSKRVISMAVACFIFSLACFATGLTTSVLWLILIRMVMGLGQSVVTPFSSGIIASHFSYRYRGIAFSIFNLGTYASFSLSLSLGTYMYDEYGWKAGYFVFGILGMAIGVLMPFVMSDNQSINVVESFDESSEPLILKGIDGTARSLSNGSYYEIVEEGDDMGTCYDSMLFPLEGNDDKLFHNERYQRISSAKTMQSGVDDVRSILQVLKAVLRCWWRQPALIILCLATGIRLGAGYIWTSYTAVYFSELYLIEDRDNDCLYSNPALDSNSQFVYISDENSTFPEFDISGISRRLDSATCGSDYPYCFRDEGECRKLNEYPWHNEGMEHIKLQSYMSWVPLVGSGIGSLLGGHASDKISSIFGQRGRPTVAALSSLVSIPFVILALASDFPACFLYFIPSGLTGEMYIGASLASVADLTPPALLVPSTALFMFFVTIIAGNCPLFIPLGLNNIMHKTYHTFTILAAPVDTTQSSNEEYLTSQRSGTDLRQVMTYVICILYAVSSLVYFFVLPFCHAPVLSSPLRKIMSETEPSHRKKDLSSTS